MAWIDGAIRFLWIQATDPMLSLPNLNRYRSAATKEGRFLVVSEAYQTPTTDVADVILPAAMWLEREGIFANVERRAQHFERLVAPPGDATSDAWLMIEVGRRLGFSKLFPWEQSRHVEQIWEEYRRFHAGPRSALPPMSELRARAGVMWPYVDGRETQWRYNTAHDPAADRTRGRVRLLRSSGPSSLDLAAGPMSRRSRRPTRRIRSGWSPARCSSTGERER